MDQCLNMCSSGLLVNGVPLDTYGGAALLDYSVGETEINNYTFQGINRTTWRNLKSVFGLRPVTITIVFKGPSLHEVKLQRAKFNLDVFGGCDLYIVDDGFYYDVACESYGAETLIGSGDSTAQIKAKYTFKGIRHDPLVSETIPAGGSIYCRSFMPFTDARLTATVGAAAASYTLGGATFSNVAAGDVLVFDGIDGKITKNGQPYAANVSWVNFPALTPGWNVNSSPDPVLFEYVPAYI